MENKSVSLSKVNSNELIKFYFKVLISFFQYSFSLIVMAILPILKKDICFNHVKYKMLNNFWCISLVLLTIIFFFFHFLF